MTLQDIYTCIHTYTHTHTYIDQREPELPENVIKTKDGYIKEYGEDDPVPDEELDTVVDQLRKRILFVKNLPKAITIDELQVCICIYVCVCIYICIYIFMYLCVCTCRTQSSISFVKGFYS